MNNGRDTIDAPRPGDVAPGLPRGPSWALLAAAGERLAAALEDDGPPGVAGLLAPALADAAALFVPAPSGLRCLECAAVGLEPEDVQAAFAALLPQELAPPLPDLELSPTEHAGLARCRLIPLLARGQTAGLLALGLAAPGPWPFEAGELSQALARTLGLGLDNIRRHAEARRALQERQAVQATLQERQALFDAIFDNAGLGIALAALEWDMSITNRAFRAIIGYSEEELRQLSVMAITHPDDLAVELELAQELADGRRQRYEMEKRYFHKDGHEVPVRITGLLVRDEAGAPRWGMALVEDISERRRAEEARDWLVSVIEATPYLVGYIDLAGNLGYLNRAARELRGVPLDASLEELAHVKFMPPWAAQLMHEVAIPTAIRQGAWYGEVAFLDAEGAEIPFAQTVLALHDRAGRVARVASISRDLREERRVAAEQIALERKMLEAQKLESLGVMAGGIAHDFNNILTSVLGHADLVLSHPALPPALEPHLSAVVAGGQRAADLTMQILAYAGKGRIAIEQVDVNRVIEEIAALIAVAVTRHCTVERQLAAGLPGVEADPAQIRQLVLNLMVNAAEAVGPAGGRLRLETAQEELDQARLDRLEFGSALVPGPYVRLSVIDNGCGMDAATLARIFDPFFTTKFTGRGLGLAAVQGIVRAHRGALQVRSAPAEGTEFHIWLPAAGALALPHSKPAPAVFGEGAVLVIDDEPAVLEVAAELLHSLGMQPHTAGDGPAGLRLLSAGLPHLRLALVDVTMPQMSGDMVARSIQAMRPGTPVVLMSGYSAEVLGEPAGDGQEQLFLQKPFTLESLRAALAAALHLAPR